MKLSSVFHRRLDYNYPRITHSRGVYLFDSKGNSYIDAVGGAFAATIGHGIASIANKVAKLIKKFSYLHGSQFTSEMMEEYAAELIAVAPRGIKKVYFVTGGSESVETAIKLARQYQVDAGYKKKYKVIYTYPGYHGASIGALSVTATPSARKYYEKYLIPFPSIPACFCYHCHFNAIYPACNVVCAWKLEEVILKENPDTVAAFIVEPVLGASAGAVVPVKEYLSIIRKICNKYKLVLIHDEIMSGYGRTGEWFASQHWHCRPDIITAGKGLSAGIVPLAAVLCSEEIFHTIKNGTGNFLHGFTFANNPITTGVGLIVLEYMKKHKLVYRAETKGEYLLSKLRVFQKLAIVGDIRGIGLFLAVEFVQDRISKRPFNRKVHLSERIVQQAMKKGLNLYFSTGFCKDGSGDAIMLGPPYTVTENQIDAIIDIFFSTVLEISRTL